MSKQLNKGLGRGFGSLLPQDFDQSMLLDKHDRIQKIPLDQIQVDPNQPRRVFDEQSLGELAQSIKRYGILQPLVVTGSGDPYHIVAGERRFRAATKAGLSHVPVLVRSLEQLERLEISLVENVQRVDLSPIEQAVSIARLHEQFNISYQEIADRLGKANTTIINIVRLLQLPDFARSALEQNKISEGHARSVLALKDQKLQQELVQNIEQQGWSVRRAEQFVSENRYHAKQTDRSLPNNKIVIDQKLNGSLSKKWGFKVVVSRRNRGGKIAMDFGSPEQLDEFVKFLETYKSR